MTVTTAPLAPARAPSADTESVRALTWWRWLALATLLLAFALRAWGLNAQSLWSDEGISINRALLPVGEMLARMPVEHAPGYFLLLGGWLRLVGFAPANVESVLRFFSLVPGVLGVALTFRLAFDLARPHALAAWTALAAALLMAVNPTQQWYAQEGRMYTWLVTTSLLSTWALWRLLHSDPARRWRFVLLYAAATAASVYLHYFGALGAIAQAIYVLIWTAGTRRWRAAGAWLVGALGALLLFAPWLPRALGIFGFSGWREDGAVNEIPLAFLRAYLVGYVTPGAAPLALLLFALTALLGALWWSRQRSDAALLLLLLIAVPMTAVILLAIRNPDYHPRYTLFVAAPLLMLVAGGVVATLPAAWRVGAVASGFSPWMLPTIALLAALTTLNLAAIYRQQTEPTLAKPDFRGAVAEVVAHARPGDVILVDGPDPELVVQRYYTGALPLFDLRNAAALSADEIEARLRADTAGADRAWELLYFHDPAGVQVWTATQAYATAPTYHQGIRVTLYGLDGPPMAATRLDLAVGDALTLITATVQSEATAGDLVRVRTDWHTNAAAPDLRFSLRLVDASGQVVASDDYVPQNWFAPTTVWRVDAPARDQRALRVPADALAQQAAVIYTLKLLLYDPASGAPLATELGNEIPLGTVEVRP